MINFTMDGTISKISEDFDSYLNDSFIGEIGGYKYYLDDIESKLTHYGTLDYISSKLGISIEDVKTKVLELCHFVREDIDGEVKYVSNNKGNISTYNPVKRGTPMVGVQTRKRRGSEITAEEIKRAYGEKNSHYVHKPQDYKYTWEVYRPAEDKLLKLLEERKGTIFSRTELQDFLGQEVIDRFDLRIFLTGINAKVRKQGMTFSGINLEKKRNVWSKDFYFVFCETHDFGRISGEFLDTTFEESI